MFKRYDPCLGAACRLKRNEGGTPAWTGPANGEEWDALFENPSGSSAKDALHFLEHSTLRSAQAAQTWAEEYEKLARRARAGSPCKSSKWLARSKYECSKGSNEVYRARRSVVDALVKQVNKNAAKAKKHEGAKLKRTKQLSNQKSNMKRPARSATGRASQMSRNLADMLRLSNR